ncbi:hypothetical protein D3C76_1321840 [compost metagenome]
MAGLGNQRERCPQGLGQGLAVLRAGDAVGGAAVNVAGHGQGGVAQQVIAAQQLDGLAITLGQQARHVPLHPGAGIAAGRWREHVGAALAGHLADAQLFEVVQALAAHLPGLLGPGRVAIAAGRADQHQAAHPLRLPMGQRRGAESAQGMADQHAVVDVQRVEQLQQAPGIVRRLRCRGGQRA